MSKLMKATCDNCGIPFLATFEQLDYSGFLTLIGSKSGDVLRAFNFCCHDCEKAFVKRLEKKHPEMKRIETEIDEMEMPKFPDYFKERTCALCETGASLRQSHIIPRFVARWLKQTSITGFLTSENPNVRLQDTFKMNLLCQNCENIFSSWEKWFAENVFFPFQNGVRDFHYDERLTKFIVSISWRLLRVQLYELADDPIRKDYAKEALETWRKYLLGRTQDPGLYENHILFLESLQTDRQELHPKFPWYAFRGIDGTIAKSDSDDVFIYAKLPGIAMVSCIHPSKFTGWKGTKINREGRLNPAQEISDRSFIPFLITRTRRGFGSRISEARQRKITAAMTKNHERFLKSGSFQALLSEGRIKRNQARQKVNPAVGSLVEIIDGGQFDPMLSLEEKSRAQYDLHFIAKHLNELPEGKARKLEIDMARAIAVSRETHSDSSSATDLGKLVVILHVCPRSSKEERIRRIKEELDTIGRNGLYPEARDLVMVTFNPLDSREGFDWSYRRR